MQIRAYHSSDAGMLMELYNATVQAYNWAELTEQQKRIMLFSDSAVADNIWQNMHTLILEDAGEIRGFASMDIAGHLRFLYTSVGQTRKGYGKALVQAMVEYATQNKLSKIYLHASKFAEERGIYEKLGFEHKGEEEYTIVGVPFRGARMERYITFLS